MPKSTLTDEALAERKGPGPDCWVERECDDELIAELAEAFANPGVTNAALRRALKGRDIIIGDKSILTHRAGECACCTKNGRFLR